MRRPAPSPILIGGGRAASRAKGAKAPEIVLEGDIGAFYEPYYCLPLSTLFHTTQRPTNIEAAGSPVLASRSFYSCFVVYTRILALLLVKPIAAHPLSPTV